MTTKLGRREGSSLARRSLGVSRECLARLNEAHSLGRGAFGLAQSRLFDWAGPSIREVHGSSQN
jgi:hypothetical protein